MTQEKRFDADGERGILWSTSESLLKQIKLNKKVANCDNTP